MANFKMLFIFISCLLIVGCYTIIKHPDLADVVIEENEYMDNNVNHYDNCIQCHTADNRLQLPLFENYHSFVWDDYYYEWNYFYAKPWWYDDIYDVSPDNGQEILPPTHIRGFNNPDNSNPASSVSTSPSGPGTSHLSKQNPDAPENIQPSKPKKVKPPEVRRQSGGKREKKKVKNNTTENQNNDPN